MNYAIVEYKGKNAYRVEGMVFKPGMNVDVSPAAWKAASRNGIFRKLVEEGKLRLVKMPEEQLAAKKVKGAAAPDGPAVDLPSPLLEMRPDEARAIIDKTYDTKLLNSWLSDENRKPVGNYIRQQLDKIEAATAVPDESK